MCQLLGGLSTSLEGCSMEQVKPPHFLASPKRSFLNGLHWQANVRSEKILRRQSGSNGLINGTPIASNGPMSRVAIVNPFTAMLAAIIPS
jgi:hypothetical protein